MLSLRESLSLGHNYIGTEHLLLALLRQPEGDAVRILTDLGADPEKIRDEVMRVLIVPAGKVLMRRNQYGVQSRGWIDDWVQVGPDRSVRHLLMAAAARALGDGRAEIETRDLVGALIRGERNAGLLAELGIDVSAVRRRMERQNEDGPLS